MKLIEEKRKLLLTKNINLIFHLNPHSKQNYLWNTIKIYLLMILFILHLRLVIKFSLLELMFLYYFFFGFNNKEQAISYLKRYKKMLINIVIIL